MYRHVQPSHYDNLGFSKEPRVIVVVIISFIVIVVSSIITRNDVVMRFCSSPNQDATDAAVIDGRKFRSTGIPIDPRPLLTFSYIYNILYAFTMTRHSWPGRPL